MLMMCWFYCIPFAKGLFFASGLLFILLALFILKRGVRQSRLGLRQMAFALIFIAIVKMFIVDIYLLRSVLTCGAGKLIESCSAQSFRAVQGAGLVALGICGFLLFNTYRGFVRERPQVRLMPEQVHLSFWANLSITLVMVLILWLAAPWVGYLTVGHVPALFMKVPWQHLAVMNVVVLLWGFWRLEDCTWTYDPAKKDQKSYKVNVWTVKDTLWVSVVLFLIALALSYASNDVLSSTVAPPGSHMNISLDSVDLNGLVPGFGPAPR